MTEDLQLQSFLDALLNGRKPESSAIVMAELAQQKSVPALYETVLKPALYRIGDLWQAGQISVAAEHLASAVVETIMNELYFRIVTAPATGKTVVAACVERELHQIGIRMVADVFEMNGWRAYFLGADTPAADLIDFIGKTSPEALALSLSIDCGLDALAKTVEAVHREYPDLLILTGGLAFHDGRQSEFLSAHPEVVHFPDLHQLDAALKDGLALPRDRPATAATKLIPEPTLRLRGDLKNDR